MGDTVTKVVETAEAQVDLSFLFTESATDETKSRVNDMFKAAVLAEAAKLTEQTEETINSLVEERLADAIEVMNETVQDQFDYAMNIWLEENAVAIESSLKVDMAESLLEGLKQLFVEHNLEIPEGSDSVLESLVAQNEELSDKLNESMKAYKDLQDKLEVAVVENILDEALEGMTDTKASKLRELAENVRYNDVEDFKAKVDGFKKSLFTESAPVVTEPTNGGPITEEVQKTKAVDPFTQSIIDRVTARL